jgi:ribosome-binding factor A
MRSHKAHSQSEITASAIPSQRLEELLREELNSILDGEVLDRNLDGVHVTAVSLSGGGALARASFTLEEGHLESDVKRADLALRRATGFLRRRVCEELSLKRTPELRFFYLPPNAETKTEADV